MKLKSKLKKILFVLPIFISCFCVSVSAAVTDKVSHGNFTFSQPSFRTYVKDWGYSDPGSDVVTKLSFYSDGVYETTFTNINGGTFGGGSNNYRCMRGMISFPYSDSDREFVIRVTPEFIVDGEYSDNFDLSLGSYTYFSNGGLTSDPYLDYTAVRDGKSVIFTVDVGNYDDIYFQFSSLCYSNWQVMTYFFDGMSIIGDDGTDDIINNQNQNTQNILNNQNENADKIIGSLGGNDDYNAPGSGNLGNLEDSESALINGNKAQSDEANNRINDNVLGSIQRLASSFGATAAMFQDMGLKLPDLSVLLYFSLILGIVPIIVGLSINNLRGHDAKVARERSLEQYKSKGG